MVVKSKKEIILSIETISGGIAIFSDGRFLIDQAIDAQPHVSTVFKTENILAKISGLLKNNNLDRKQIGTIVVATETSSLTGGKIGAVISKGLARAFGCRLFEVSALESLLLEAPDGIDGHHTTVVPVGKDRVRWQRFMINEKNTKPTLLDEGVAYSKAFFEDINLFSGQQIILPSEYKAFCKFEIFLQDIDYMVISRRSLAELCLTKYRASDKI